jgi:type II secretory pathway pseudopilin PulG
MQRLRSRAGFTVVELLIAAIAMGIVMTAAFRFYTGQHQQAVQQFAVSDTQQNLRSVMEELTRKIRLAGYRVFGGNAIITLAGNTWLAVKYHDGTAVRTQLFFPYANATTGRTDLMSQIDGGAMQVFAEGIDSVKFTPGGTGPGTQWLTVDLVAKTARPGFQVASTGGYSDTTKYLYRRLSSVVDFRNR